MFAVTWFNNAYSAIVKVKLFFCIGEMISFRYGTRISVNLDTMSSPGYFDRLSLFYVEFSDSVFMQTISFICRGWCLAAKLDN